MKYKPSMATHTDTEDGYDSLDIDDVSAENVKDVNLENSSDLGSECNSASEETPNLDGESEENIESVKIECDSPNVDDVLGECVEDESMLPTGDSKFPSLNTSDGSDNKSSHDNDVKFNGKKDVKIANSTSLNDGLILVATTDHPLANLDNCLENSDETPVKTVNKKDRRVHFHENETLGVVKSFHEPPDPWLNPPAFTPQQLVDSYRRACSNNGCKPIHKLLGQLEATRDLGERYDTLTLKGERLDKRHCDAVEEILKRVQFKTIDLEATDLDDDSAGAIFDMIEFYDSATRVVLAYNKSIGPRGWQACSRLIKRTPSLKHLDLRSCTISEHSMPFLGRALRVGSHLQVLHLENSGISGKVLLILVAALKLNEPLRELYLADNRLMPSDGIQLGNLLKHNDRLQLLDLRNNHLQDTGLSHISDGVESQDQKGWGLTTLVLWNNQLTQHSMVKLAQALAVNRTLETVNLGHNNLGNEGILTLKEGLLSNRVLKRLGLQASRLSCEAAIAIAELIADSKCLVRIDLRENEVKTAGLMALSLSLKMNQSVTRLDLDKEPKKERGVKDFMEQQASLLSDISNWLQRNREQAYCLEQELQKLERESQEANDGEKVSDGPGESVGVDSETVSEGEQSEQVSERGETDKVHHKPVVQLRFDLSRSQSLDSPAQPPDGVVPDDDDDVINDVSDVAVPSSPTSPPPPDGATDHASHTRKRHGNRLFSVKYVPESTLLESGVSIIPVSPSDTVLSPTLEFPLSLDPAKDSVLPVLVPVDMPNDPSMPILVPLDQRNESESKTETETETETESKRVDLSVETESRVGSDHCEIPVSDDGSDSRDSLSDTRQTTTSDTIQNVIDEDNVEDEHCDS